MGDWRKQRRRLISPLVGEMSGRTEGGAVPPASQSFAPASPWNDDVSAYCATGREWPSDHSHSSRSDRARTNLQPH
ncbi:hypothetical protein EN873_19715 [bacterium M00.F.Ca.ET.230.01.1.1]|nr:hypothetical protein EN873_19715 [bacterium M00.F.Ca.ET.230.01.1.1]